MRLFILAGLAAGAIAVFAPEQGAGLMRSVVHGFGWGIGREIAHNFLAIAIGDDGRELAGADALELQRPLPEDALRIVARGERSDKVRIDG